MNIQFLNFYPVHMPDDLKSKASIMVREFIILYVKVHNFTIEVKERRYIRQQMMPNPN